MKLVIAVIIAVAPALAHAQPGLVPTTYAGPPGSELPGADLDAPSRTAPSDASPIDRARDNMLPDRGLVSGTALTTPPGHLETSLRIAPGGAMLNASAGVADGTELWGEVSAVSRVGAYGGGITQAIATGRHWQVALAVSIHGVREQASDDAELGDQTVMFAGGVVSGCAGDHCSVLVSAGGGVADANHDRTSYAHASLAIGNATGRILFEAIELGGGTVGVVGARLGSSWLALEGGAAIALGSSGVLPILGVAGRL